MKNTFRIAAILLIFNALAQAQTKLPPIAPPTQKPAEKDDPDPEVFTGTSAIILKKDATEVNFVNSLSSFWVAINGYSASLDAVRIENRLRFSRADHLVRVSHGFSKNRRWDLGADFFYTHVRVDDEARSSPLRVFGKSEPGISTVSRGLSGLGLNARFMLFENIPELTLRASINYPIARTAEKRFNLNAQRTLFGLTGTFYQRLGPAALYFLQGDFRAAVPNSENKTLVLQPNAAAFLIIETPGGRLNILPGLSYGTAFQKFSGGGKLRKTSTQMFGSLGLLFRSGDVTSFLFSLQGPLVFESGSARSIWVRESFFGMNLGFRTVFGG